MAQSSVIVVLGEGVATIRRGSSFTVANILGIKAGADGTPETVWLDRLVHAPAESEFTGWDVSGAVASVLRRAAVVVTAK